MRDVNPKVQAVLQPSASRLVNQERKSGDLCIVNVPVKVLFEWSDKIIADYDSETDTVLEYKSGYVMRVLPNQSVVYDNHQCLLLAATLLPQ